MKGLIEYLDDLKEKTGSDYATAKALNISKVSVSLMRKREQMADETAVKIAEALGIDPDEVLIAAAIARSEGTVKTAWINHAKKAGIAASFALALILPRHDAEAAEGKRLSLPDTATVYYVKLYGLQKYAFRSLASIVPV